MHEEIYLGNKYFKADATLQYILMPFILGTWGIKVIIALIDTPFVYLGTYLYRRI
jgi:uncharacterized PurR-regulated membrane protein YhhQ (DUF165 family)